jgi:hypothetical protein
MLSPTRTRLTKTLPLRSLIILSFAIAATLPANASGPDLTKYPLRIQVLAATAHQSIAKSLFSNSGPPQIEGADIPSSGAMGAELDYNTPIFNGQGWGNLVSTEVPQALRFTYESCLNRIPVTLTKEPLAARWKKFHKGKKATMEVLVPMEVIPSAKHPAQSDKVRYAKCDLPVTLYTYVYLHLHNGSLIRVTKQAYLAKPALHEFAEGPSPTLKQRPDPAVPSK